MLTSERFREIYEEALAALYDEGAKSLSQSG
jgi:hypothetical protein